MRKLCLRCIEYYVPQEAELENLGLDPNIFKGKKIARAKGCHECSGTGYRGRMVVHELMILDDDIRARIMEKVDSTMIKKVAQAHGMINLRQAGIEKVISGITSAVELVSVTQE